MLYHDTVFITMLYHDTVVITMLYHDTVVITMLYQDTVVITMLYHHTVVITMLYHHTVVITMLYHDTVFITMLYHHTVVMCNAYSYGLALVVHTLWWSQHTMWGITDDMTYLVSIVYFNFIGQDTSLLMTSAGTCRVIHDEVSWLTCILLVVACQR